VHNNSLSSIEIKIEIDNHPTMKIASPLFVLYTLLSSSPCFGNVLAREEDNPLYFPPSISYAPIEFWNITQPKGMFHSIPSYPGLTPYNWVEFAVSNERYERQYAQTKTSEVFSTGFISKGNGPVFELEYDDNLEDIMEEIDNLEYTEYDMYSFNPRTKKRVVANKAMEDMSTDAMMITWKGKIVYEKYFNPQCPNGGAEECEPKFDASSRHNLWSATKSYAGIMVAMLIEEGIISEDELIVNRIGELDVKNGAFATVTVRQVLDMTAQFFWAENNKPGPCNKTQLFSFDFDETEIGIKFPITPNCEQLQGNIAGNPHLFPPEFFLSNTDNKFSRYPGAQNRRDHLMALKDNENELNDQTFTYRTANTEVLSWLVEKVTGRKAAEYFSKKIWSKLGQKSDAVIRLDTLGGYDWWGAGSMTTAQDAARFGEMMRNGGRNAAGVQVVPESVVDDIKAGGTSRNVEQFAQLGNNNLGMNCFVNPYPGVCGWPNDELPEDLPTTRYLKALGLKKDQSGYTYRNQYWVWGDHMFYQDGIFNQNVMVFPKIDLVITKFSSPSTEGGEFWRNMNLFLEIAGLFAEKTMAETPNPTMAETPNPTMAETPNPSRKSPKKSK